MNVLFRKHEGGEIAFARIGEENDDGLSFVFFALSELDRGGKCGAGRNADEQAFRAGGFTALLKRFFVGDGKDFIINGCVEGLWHEPSADALDLMRSGDALGEDGRSLRLNGDDVDARLLFL